jgi:hypothetical protein
MNVTGRARNERHEFGWSALWSSLPPQLSGAPETELADRVRDAVTGLLEGQGVHVEWCVVTVVPAVDWDGTVEEGRLVLLVDVLAGGWEPLPFERARLVTHAVDRVASSVLAWTVAPG